MSLKNLGYLVENELEAKILSSDGNQGVRGTLSVKYFPTDETGEGEPDEDLLPEEPEELEGKAIAFRVEIEKAQDLPNDMNKNVFVTYGLFFDKGDKSVQTPEVAGKNKNPVFNFKHVHHFDMVTPSILRYLANGNLCFKVYGYPDFEQARKMQKKEIDQSKQEESKKDTIQKQKTM